MKCIRCLSDYKEADIYWLEEDSGIAVCLDCASVIVTEWVNGEIEHSSQLDDLRARLDADLAKAKESHPLASREEMTAFLNRIASGEFSA